MITTDSKRWPPLDLPSYFGSAQFLKEVRRIAQVLGKYQPFWAEDAVFDTVASMIAKTARHSQFLNQFESPVHLWNYIKKASSRRANRYAKRSAKLQPIDGLSLSTLDRSLKAHLFRRWQELLMSKRVNEILTPRELQVIKLRLEGYTLNEIGERLNMHTTTVHDAVKNSEEKLRRLTA